jgi:outer membrane protein TolC
MKLRALLSVSLLLLAAAPGEAKAQSVEAGATAAPTLRDVLDSVDQRYPLILAAIREQAEASGATLSAEGGFDPSLRASGTIEPISGYKKQYAQVALEQPTALWGTTFYGGYRIGNGSIPTYDGKIETNDYGEVRAGLRLPLWRDGAIDRRRAALRQAELGAEIAKLSTEQQRIEARRLGTLRYWEWIAAGARLRVVQGWLALAKDRDAGLGARVAQGDVPLIERQENQRAIFQRETALAGAEREAAQSAIELSLFLRGPDGKPRTPTDAQRPTSLPNPAAGDFTAIDSPQSAVSARPDIRRFQVQRSRSEVELELANNQRRPAIDLLAGGSKDLGPGEYKRGLPVAEVGVVLDIPILNRVQNGRAQTAEAQVGKINEQLRLAADRALADIKNALIGIQVSKQRVDMTASEVAMAKQLAEAELKRFELGESNLLLVNLREQASAEAQVRHVDVLLDYHRSIAVYRAALGRNESRDGG